MNRPPMAERMRFFSLDDREIMLGVEIAAAKEKLAVLETYESEYLEPSVVPVSPASWYAKEKHAEPTPTEVLAFALMAAAAIDDPAAWAAVIVTERDRAAAHGPAPAGTAHARALDLARKQYAAALRARDAPTLELVGAALTRYSKAGRLACRLAGEKLWLGVG